MTELIKQIRKKKILRGRGLLNCGNYTDLQVEPALRSFIYQDVGEPTCHPCSTTGMMQDFHPPTRSNLAHLSTCGNCYVVVKRYSAFRGFHLSESVVFHLDFWVSSSIACLLVCVCVWVVLFRLWKDTWLFAFSYNVRIADRPQDVLMTVRASSVHGMS